MAHEVEGRGGRIAAVRQRRRGIARDADDVAVNRTSELLAELRTALRELDATATGLDAAATRLDDAVARFEALAPRLTEVLERLDAAGAPLRRLVELGESLLAPVATAMGGADRVVRALLGTGERKALER